MTDSGLNQARRRLYTLQRAVQRRGWLRVLGFALPLLTLLGAAVLRSAVLPATQIFWWLALLTLLLMAAAVGWAHRHYSLSWLLRQLDHHVPTLEDSSVLLLAQPVDSSLAAMQQSRIAQRLNSMPMPELRASWLPRRMLLVWSLALAGLLVLQFMRLETLAIMPPAASARADAPSVPGQTRVLEARLKITPPAYTGLPARQQSELAARVPEDSSVQWSLVLAPQPMSAALQFVDGQRLELVQEAGAWTGSLQLRQASLYRLEVATDAPPLVERELHALGVIVDTAPQLRVLAPQLSLTRHTPGTRDWVLELEASDDYGLGVAELLLTRTQGTGEQVTVSEQRIPLRGRGTSVQRRYSHSVDLDALTLAEGDDLIARFVVSDLRRPQSQSTRSPSYILRWPAPPIGEAGGVEGLVNTTLPAYFRSQRQIIIDTEALLAETPRRPAEDFGIRADEIGVDQRLLRLRYGQFLGEEFEPPPAPPGLGQAEHPDADHAEAEHHPGDGHDHGAENGAASAFGDAVAVQAEYGHIHDIPEAATLLDPATRKLLKAALDEMWQAELYLRSAQPKSALPYEYRALEFIKQVQQGSRIYLARVGLELPPIDFQRRLTGDREGLRPRADPLTAASTAPDEIGAGWRALDDWQLAPSGDMPARQQLQERLTALLRGVTVAKLDTDQRLALLASIDAVQQDPFCSDCVVALRRDLWTLLDTPPAAVPSRVQADVSGRAYLDALQQHEEQP